MSYKRIAILVSGLPPVYNGGTEIATVQIAKYAVRAGHEVHIIALDGTNKGKELYKSQNGYIVHRIRTIPISYLFGLFSLLGIVLRVSSIKPDILHAQGEQMGILALIASKLTGIPFIFYGRGAIYVHWLMKDFITRLIIKNADRVIAQTEHMKKEMLKYVNREIEVIPNGIDISLYSNINKAIARRELGYFRDEIVILCVGRLRPEKNVASFVKAACWWNNGFINKRNEKRRYVVVGGGEQFDGLKKLASDSGLKQIDFVGDVENSRVPIYMKAADIFVNTSSSEGFPMAVLEAMSAGLPIIAPNVCGIPELFDSMQNGALLIDPNDYTNIGHAINLLISNWNIRENMSLNNQKKVKEFTWENVVKKLYG